jgi:hypothetical protein
VWDIMVTFAWPRNSFTGLYHRAFTHEVRCSEVLEKQEIDGIDNHIVKRKTRRLSLQFGITAEEEPKSCRGNGMFWCNILRYNGCFWRADRSDAFTSVFVCRAGEAIT